MNRRRFLSSVGSADEGLIVNNGVITKQNITYKLQFEYPVASIIEINCGDYFWVFNIGDTDTTYTPVPGESIGTNINFYPSDKDDIYFYKVTINI